MYRSMSFHIFNTVVSLSPQFSLRTSIISQRHVCPCPQNWSIFCLYSFTFSKNFILLESYNVQPRVCVWVWLLLFGLMFLYVSSVLWHLSVVCYFILLNSIPLCRYAPFCSSIPQSMAFGLFSVFMLVTLSFIKYFLARFHTLLLSPYLTS